MEGLHPSWEDCEHTKQHRSCLPVNPADQILLNNMLIQMCLTQGCVLGTRVMFQLAAIDYQLGTVKTKAVFIIVHLRCDHVICQCCFSPPFQLLFQYWYAVKIPSNAMSVISRESRACLKCDVSKALSRKRPKKQPRENSGHKDLGGKQPARIWLTLFSQQTRNKSLGFVGASQHFTLINNKQNTFSSCVGQQIEMCLCYQQGSHN